MYWILGLFVLIAVVEFIAAIALFRAKELLHAIVLLTILFISTSFLYLQLSQPLLAVLQILVMVGGISTYLFVGVASQSFLKFKHTNMLLLALGSLLIFAAMIYPIAKNHGQYASAGVNVFSIQSQSQFLALDITLFYIIAILLFVLGIGAIVLYRKIGAGKWR